MAYGKDSKNNMFVSKCTINKPKHAFLSSEKAVCFLAFNFQGCFLVLSRQAIPTEWKRSLAFQLYVPVVKVRNSGGRGNVIIMLFLNQQIWLASSQDWSSTSQVLCKFSSHVMTATFQTISLFSWEGRGGGAILVFLLDKMTILNMLNNSTGQ